jgi:hypothetical protein
MKGMWMGGNIPLGYDVRDRKLVINTEEAAKVGEIFTLLSYYTTVGWFRGPGHDLQTDSYR